MPCWEIRKKTQPRCSDLLSASPADSCITVDGSLPRRPARPRRKARSRIRNPTFSTCDRSADRRQAWITNEEDQLADVLRPFGDLIAIGRPGERLPTPGAARMYVADTDWQTTILDRMRIAPLVVIRAGVGQGLFWELGQAITTLDPERMLILVLDISASDYAAFAAQAQTVLGLSLPALERFGPMNAVVNYRENPSRLRPGFISFSSDWTPEFLPIRTTIVRTSYNDLRKSFDVALRPVFARNRVDWRPTGRFRDAGTPDNSAS